MERTAERTAKKQGEMDAFHGRKEETPDASNAEGSSVSEDGAGGGTRTHTVSPPADFESATSTIPSHRHTVKKYISSTAKFQVFSFSILGIGRGRHFGLRDEPQVHVCRLGNAGYSFCEAVLPHVTRIIEIGEFAFRQREPELIIGQPCEVIAIVA